MAITLHYSIEDTTDDELTPMWGDDDDSSALPTLDAHFESGTVELVHVGSGHEWVVVSSYARFPMREEVSAQKLRASLAVTGKLSRLLEDVLAAARMDAGMIAACEAVSKHLRSLTIS